jgi:PIN domain nuclease of toxin-antitoxin system
VILLLDAHALLWALTDNPTLRDETREAIASPANDVLVSAATVWELAIKRQLGKLEAPDDLVGAIAATHFVGLAVTLSDAESAAALPRHHAHPFDRMLVAQAQRVGATLVTRDSAFTAYGIDVLRA